MKLMGGMTSLDCTHHNSCWCSPAEEWYRNSAVDLHALGGRIPEFIDLHRYELFPKNYALLFSFFFDTKLSYMSDG
ncbi:hypothetical protein PISMIDRAFT_688050 [Pisolithus microcarpus 441]|uniref:Uncharacterized protein n=1 Tax=Pisolithus microcarpus 441 TaxID=765257 RepID=A0A0C9Z2R7_9AGAM|nr:hypothetical protein PISMIDRAFT_688050 [Pisolithus microcarpus 441]